MPLPLPSPPPQQKKEKLEYFLVAAVARPRPPPLLWLCALLLLNICLQQSSASSAATVADDNSNLPSKAHSSFASHSGGDFFPALNEFSSHSVIRPQIHHGRHKRAIRSTLDAEDGMHLPEITLKYYHEGRNYYIDLQRNDRLLPDEHFLRYQNARTPAGYVVQNFTKTEAELCHYQGSIRGVPDSRAAISTCHGGVNGVVFDGIDTHFIHSGSDGRLQDEHFLFRHSDLINPNTTCGYNSVTDDDNDDDDDDDDDVHHGPKPQKVLFAQHGADDAAGSANIPNRIDGSEFNRILRYKRSYDDSNVIRGPYNANKHSSYVELVIVVDNKVYKSFGENPKKVHQHCKDLANIINALYVPLNIFVALVGVVIWNESNEIEFSSDGDVTLRNFLNYRRTKLVLEHPNDNAQLLTKEQFTGGVVGKALKGPICTHEYSGGVSMQHSQIIAVVATTMAHEMGHNFGMEHDSPDCKCQDEKCIMSASSTSVVPVHWSSCSIDQLNIAFSRGMNYCLRNKPAKLFDSPQCGNGFVEPGEQCDCGLPNYCENTCCDPYTCMLHTNASCATGECCDLSTCRPKQAGTACRVGENECDLPEYCSGESEYCPVDVFKRDTEACDAGQAFCFQGQCRSHSNQCRILWGSTGESSEHCYWKNTDGKRGGNCGYNRINNTFIACETEHVACGMLHCRHLNERLEFGMESAAVLSHSFINHGGNIVACRTALVDLGLQSTDPGLTPNGAKCGEDKMCVNQKCRTVEQLRATGMGKACPEQCNGNGVCNSRGNCHCDIGYTGATCLAPGPGGSPDSGPATNPNSHDAFQRFMYIFFFAVIPCMAAFCYFMYYCRNHQLFVGGKLAENIIKSAGGSKQQPPRGPTHQGGGGGGSPSGLPKSTPSSTDDMNSALLKSPSGDSHDAAAAIGNGGMFGKFKGFTLRPLNDSTSTPTSNLNGPNVAYVQPTVQEAAAAANGSVPPQRAAPPPPIVKGGDAPKMNGTLGRKAPAPPAVATSNAAPALPPPNPGSHARPIISMPVLEASTLTLPLKRMSSGGGADISPIRAAPTPPSGGTIKAAPVPPVPLHADPKLNVKRDGTIRRIASFLKKDSPPAAKEKTYIERDKLRQLEISAPMPCATSGAANTTAPQGESSNSDSETAMTPKEEETKNLVKRAQSMRSPTKKTHVQSFGSMRQAPGAPRPKSVVTAANAAVRPKSPPPRPPPLLKKTHSTTSSGYQLPVATAKKTTENAYDDCEFVELPLTKVERRYAPAPAALSSSSPAADNIYAVIDEIPPAAQTLKRSDFVNSGCGAGASGGPRTSSGDMGLLGEIVNEIEKRNGGDSIYTGATLSKGKLQSSKEQSTVAAPLSLKSPPPAQAETKATDAVAVAAAAAASVPTYLRPTPVKAPVARVAPTRSDLSPSTTTSATSAFSSFKPLPAVSSVASKTAAPQLAATHTSRYGGASSSTSAAAARNKSFGNNKTHATSKTLPGGGGLSGSTTAPPSATIQKPKLLSAKPSFSSQNQKKAASGAGSAASVAAAGRLGTNATPPRITPAAKSNNIASLTQRFEKGASGGASATAGTAAARK